MLIYIVCVKVFYTYNKSHFCILPRHTIIWQWWNKQQHEEAFVRPLIFKPCSIIVKRWEEYMSTTTKVIYSQGCHEEGSCDKLEASISELGGTQYRWAC